MSKIRGKETKPEILVRKYLFSKGFRYRIHDERYPGKPDIVLPKYRSVIFVHGCFWHGHEGCKAARLPKTNPGFWERKISSNVERDRRNVAELQKQGWNLIIIWECELRNKRERENRFRLLEEQIKNYIIE